MPERQPAAPTVVELQAPEAALQQAPASIWPTVSVKGPPGLAAEKLPTRMMTCTPAVNPRALARESRPQESSLQAIWVVVSAGQPE